MTQILALVSTALNLIATGIYLAQIAKNRSTPNPSSWAIWLFINIVNTVTYFLIVDKSFWITLASLTSASVVSLIFLFSLFKGKFTKINHIDVISLVLTLGIAVFSKISGNAIIPNAALQIIFAISFIPTINSLLTGIAKERPAPWLLGVTAYALQIVIVLLNPVTLWALVFPLIQVLGQGSIAAIAIHKNSSNLIHSSINSG